MGEPEWFQDDESLNMGANVSHDGCDFNYRGNESYWSLELETADLFREHGLREGAFSLTLGLSVFKILGTFVIILWQKHLWYSKDWKEYVWYLTRCFRQRSTNHTGDLEEKTSSRVNSPHASRIQRHLSRRRRYKQRCLRKGSYKVAPAKQLNAFLMNYDAVDSLGGKIQGNIHNEITVAERVQRQWRARR